MYIKDRIGWQIFPSDEKLVHLGCDTKASTMSIGTKDSYSFELITNEKVAMVLDKDGNATFSGTVTLGVMT
ncbi:hypothetical protein CVPH_1535 [Abyssogena phaseoliformis symbiont OG214]|nr:hypothetical protein CVPH_1535 [Abyssogena phaseoliformis symbiont OG214]